MNILIIGGVAAGTKAAAKLKREDRNSSITIITKGKDISYAGCGLPYYVGGLIEEREQLIVNTPEKYSGLTGVDVKTGIEATCVDKDKKIVYAKDENGNDCQFNYDKLIIATGASPFVPDMPGVDLDCVFTMRTPDDAIDLRNYITEHNCRKAIVCGGSFIGLEVAENLKAQGLDVRVVDLADQILGNIVDKEIAEYVKKHLKKERILINTGVSVQGIESKDNKTVVNTSNGNYDADVVVMAVGVKPNTAFLNDTGIEMFKGTILVDETLATNVKDIYAAGDCAMVKNRLTNKPQWSPMGSTANMSARTLAQSLSGKDKKYKGVLGTGVVKLPGMNVGRTGLGEDQAKDAGYNVETITCVVDDKAHYYPGADTFMIKLIADKDTHAMLGVQVLGSGNVDKVVDVAVMAISMKAKLEDLENLDFAYAPPFSTAIHPLVTATYILENKLNGEFETFTPREYLEGKAKEYTVLDVQPEPKISNAKWIDLAKVTGPIDGLDKDAKLLLVCAKGKRGYFLQNRLKAYGYTNTKVLEGGAFVNDVVVQRNGKKLSAADIKRVKGLGCLQDKRYDDIFNVRVITRNGKLTTAEQMAVAEAAEKYGTGEVTMTTRLTLEIQGVPYDSIDEVREFLSDKGLDIGGTGSKVRPVVSCKGTTCQYGLIDTFDLSEKLHNLYYIGYHGIDLPHKFKIAVGGCPNNCVKPDLNDLGIIGQRIPQIDASKCRNCKVCQVVNNCPLKDAQMKDGVITIDTEKCNHCGRCIGKCPFDAVTEELTGYKVYIGGRWGKKIAHGKALDRIFTSEEEVIALVESAILFFRDEGISGERFADTIDRLGFDYVQDKLLNSTIDKDKVLEKKVVGGATC